MNRLSLVRCELFGALPYRELATLLGCLGASYNELAPGAAIYTDRLIIVLSGNLLAQGRCYKESEVLLCDGQPRSVSALTRSEALFVHPRRLQTICGNACRFHNAVVNNLVKLSMKSLPPY